MIMAITADTNAPADDPAIFMYHSGKNNFTTTTNKIATSVY